MLDCILLFSGLNTYIQSGTCHTLIIKINKSIHQFKRMQQTLATTVRNSSKINEIAAAKLAEATKTSVNNRTA